jgi:hypothetical protein
MVQSLKKKTWATAAISHYQESLLQVLNKTPSGVLSNSVSLLCKYMT